MPIMSFSIPTVDITVDGHTITTPAYELNPGSSLYPTALGTTSLRENVKGWYNDTYMIAVAKQIVDHPGITKETAAKITKQAHQYMKTHLNRGLDEIRTDRGTTPTKTKTPTLSNAVLKVSTHIVNAALNLRKDQTDRKIPTYENSIELLIKIGFTSQGKVSGVLGDIFDNKTRIFNGIVWPTPLLNVKDTTPTDLSKLYDNLYLESPEEFPKLVKNIINKVIKLDNRIFKKTTFQTNEKIIFDRLSLYEWKSMIGNIQRLIAGSLFTIAPLIPHLKKMFSNEEELIKYITSFTRDAVMKNCENDLLTEAEQSIQIQVIKVIFAETLSELIPYLLRKKPSPSPAEIVKIAQKLRFYLFSEVNTTGKFVLQELVDKLKDVVDSGNLHYQKHEKELLEFFLEQFFDKAPSKELALLIQKRNDEFFKKQMFKEKLEKAIPVTYPAERDIINRIPPRKYLSSHERKSICNDILRICTIAPLKIKIEAIRDQLGQFSDVKRRMSMKRPSAAAVSAAEKVIEDETLQLMDFDDLVIPRVTIPASPAPTPPPASAAVAVAT